MQLLEGPATQKELREKLGISSGFISRQMSILEYADLVTRTRSHGPYEIVHGRALTEVLGAAAELNLLQLQARAEVAQQDLRAMDRSRIEGGELQDS